jgi:hypothetical protein
MNMQLTAICLHAVRVRDLRLATDDEVRFRCIDTHKFPRFLEEHAVTSSWFDPVQTIARFGDP